jgi:iron complex outermembrane receptor protein
VRTPSRAEDDVRLNSAVIPPGTPGNPSSLPAIVAFVGGNDAEAEKLISYELGYRTNPVEWLSLDFAGFYNDYDDLRAVVREPAFLEGTPTSPHLTTPLVIDNAMTAEAFGFEAVANVQFQSWWRLQGSYSFLELDAVVPAGFDPTQASDVEGASPEQQATLRSMMDVRDDISLDAALRFVDELPTFDVDAYATLDLRIAWRPSDGLELAVMGRNLLDPGHPEFGSEGLFATQPTEAPRSIFFSVAARF